MNNMNGLNRNNPTSDIKEFVFNNVSASIINTVLAAAFCIIIWLYYLCIGFNASDWFFTMFVYTLLWLIPTVLYNRLRYKEGHKGTAFMLTLLIPYGVCFFAGFMYVELFVFH